MLVAFSHAVTVWLSVALLKGDRLTAKICRSFRPLITRLQLISTVSSGGNFHAPYAESGQCLQSVPGEIHAHAAARSYPESQQCY